MIEFNKLPENPILIVDDETHLLRAYSINLNEAGFDNIVTCSDSREVISILEGAPFEMVLLDLTMPYITGDKLLKEIKSNFPGIPVIIITGNNDIENAIDCMREGAFDYLLKPIESARLESSVRRAFELQELKRENDNLKKQMLNSDLQNPDSFKGIVTNDGRMKGIFRYMEAISKTSEPVLVTGETGTGKEVIAKAFYNVTDSKGEFVTVNVAGLDDQMFTDALFGHTKGAFTDAVKERAGLIEKASGGVIFLDEIGDLSMASQVKLLRLLQEKEFYPLGSDTPRYTDAKIIVATNRDLYNMQQEGKFRKDLYYRLNVHHISIPSLRDRVGDIPLLIEHFLTQASEQMDKSKPTTPYELLTLLSTYHFPGNIRELRAMVYDSVASHEKGILSLESFKRSLEKSDHCKSRDRGSSEIDSNIVKFSDLLPTLKDVQKLLIKEALKRAEGNQSIAASLLGITRQGLNKRLKGMEE